MVKNDNTEIITIIILLGHDEEKKRTVVDSRLDTSQTVKVHNLSPYFVKLLQRPAFCTSMSYLSIISSWKSHLSGFRDKTDEILARK